MNEKVPIHIIIILKFCRRYVLTVAQCVISNYINEVVLGDWNLEHDPDCAGDVGGCKPDSSFKKAQRFNITAADITIHEDFDFDKLAKNGNDIALIRLPRLAKTYFVDFDEIVAPVCLGWDNTIEVPKSKYLVAGWGLTTNDVFGDHSAILQKLEVPFIPINVCKTDYDIYKNLTIKQVCAGGIPGNQTTQLIFEFHSI